MSKKYLKGFANLGFFKVSEDTQDTYKAETSRTKIPSARSCAPTDNRSDYSIPGDDGVWDGGSEWTDTTNEITINEIELKILAEMIGATINEDGSIDESSLDNAPLLAINYSALLADNGYRLFLYYCCKVTNVKVSHTTKSSDNTDAQSYTLTFKCVPRKCDGKIRRTIDVEKGTKLTWLDTVDPYPITSTEPEEPAESTGE